MAPQMGLQPQQVGLICCLTHSLRWWHRRCQLKHSFYIGCHPLLQLHTQLALTNVIIAAGTRPALLPDVLHNLSWIHCRDSSHLAQIHQHYTRQYGDYHGALQTQVAFVSGITAAATSPSPLPELPPYIVAEALEGAAYASLPNPKGGVLTPITAVVTDLYNRISSVSLLSMYTLVLLCVE